jgi:hypothetical protein
MKLTLAGLLVATFVFAANAQDLSNATIQQRIRSVKVDNGITLTFDEAGRTSKLMAISDNFAKDETSRAGLLAMNFALGCIYAGDSLSKSPDNFIFTFWVLTRKPRFSENHAMTVALGEEMLVIGSARYVAKSSQQMEYLNFEISRANLAKIAAETNVRFHLGDDVFVFSRSQLKLIAETLAVTEVGN